MVLFSLGFVAAVTVLRVARGNVACWDCVENGSVYKVVYSNVVPTTSCVQDCTDQTNFLFNMTQCLRGADQCVDLPMSMANSTALPDYPANSCFTINQCSECKENDNCTFLMDTQGSTRCVPKGFVTGADSHEMACDTGACYDCINNGLTWRAEIDKTGISTACVEATECSEIGEILGFTRCLTIPQDCNLLPPPAAQSEGHIAHSPDSCFVIPDGCHCDLREDCVGLEQVAKDDSTGELAAIAKQCYPKRLIPSGEGVQLERCEWDCVAATTLLNKGWSVAYAPHGMFIASYGDNSRCMLRDRVWGIHLCIERPSACAAVPDSQGVMHTPDGRETYSPESCFAYTDCLACNWVPECLFYEDVDGKIGCLPKGFVTSANIWPSKCRQEGSDSGTLATPGLRPQ